MAVCGVQLMLLACIMVTSQSLTCNDITCCTGTVCVEETRGSNQAIVARCVVPPNCNELTCPDGYVCVNETQGRDSTHSGASCQASCDDVVCPSFLQCVEQGSTTKCVIPDECLFVECPFGTSCEVLQRGRKSAAVCLADSCASVECFSGSECFSANVDSPNALMRIFEGKFPSMVKERTHSHIFPSGSGSGSGSGSAGGSGQQGRDVATCLPTCGGGDVCPQGFVCEVDRPSLVCREAQSCFELQCPVGQKCQEVTCGNHRARRSLTGTRTTTGGPGNVLVQCVDVTDDPSILEKIGNEGAASLQNGAISLAATKQGAFISAVAVLVLPICAVFLLFI